MWSKRKHWGKWTRGTRACLFCKELVQGINLNKNSPTHTHTRTSTVYTTKQSQLSESSLQSPSLSPLLTTLLLFSPLFLLLFFPLNVCHWRLLRLNQAHKDAQEQLLFVCHHPLLRSKSPFILSCLFLLATECALACPIKLKRWDWDVALCCAVHNSLFLPLCPLYSWLPVCYLCMTSSWADWWTTNSYSVKITAAL